MSSKKVSTTAKRLAEIMAEKGLRQVDLLAVVKPYCLQYDVKMNKSNLSQYCNGTNEPLQDKLFVLSLALNVSEGWLMGFDVPKERVSDAVRFAETASVFNQTHEDLPSYEERALIIAFRKSDQKDRKRLLDLANRFAEVNESQMLKAAHHRTDSQDDHDSRIMSADSEWGVDTPHD